MHMAKEHLREFHSPPLLLADGIGRRGSPASGADDLLMAAGSVFKYTRRFKNGNVLVSLMQSCGQQSSSNRRESFFFQYEYYAAISVVH